MNRTRSGRWGRRALASLLACSAVLVAALAIAGTASAYEEHQFCTGKNLSGEEGCGSGEWYVHSAYANGTSAPICLIGPEQVGGGCMHATNEGIWLGASEPYGYWGRALIVHTINQPPTKVYGTFWTGAPAPKGESPPPPPPSSWHYESIAGNTIAQPVIESVGPSQKELVITGTDNALYYRTWLQGAGWSEWSPVAGGTGAVASGPGVSSWGESRVDIVARLSNNTVQHWWWDGSSWHTDNLGGNIIGEPVIQWESATHMDLVAEASNHTLIYRSWDSKTGWSEWIPVAGGTGEVTSSPSITSPSAGRLDVVARVANNSVQHWWWDGSSWHSENLGGSITASPTIDAQNSTHMDLFVRGTDNALYYRSWEASTGWGGWTTVASGTGEVSSAPDATSWGAEEVDIVARKLSGEIGLWRWGR
jgi:hypothetical protein